MILAIINKNFIYVTTLSITVRGYLAAQRGKRWLPAGCWQILELFTERHLSTPLMDAFTYTPGFSSSAVNLCCTTASEHDDMDTQQGGAEKWVPINIHYPFTPVHELPDLSESQVHVQYSWMLQGPVPSLEVLNKGYMDVNFIKTG